MNPYPFASLNHLTVPVAINTSSCQIRTGRGALCAQPVLARIRRNCSTVVYGGGCAASRESTTHTPGGADCLCPPQSPATRLRFSPEGGCARGGECHGPGSQGEAGGSRLAVALGGA